MRFRNRIDAGRQLAAHLTKYGGRSDVIVFGLPRGGIPVAYEVARRLEAPLEVFLVRKLGVPGHPELAMGAIASGGIKVLSRDLIQELGIPEHWSKRRRSASVWSSIAGMLVSWGAAARRWFGIAR